MILNEIDWDDSSGQPSDVLPMKDSFVREVENSNAFATSYTEQLGDAASAELVVSNNTTDKVLLVRSAFIRGAGYAEANLKTGTTIDTAGNGELTTTLNVGSGATPSATVDANGSYSGGSLATVATLPGGSGALGSSVQHGEWKSPPTIIQPDSSGSIEVTNQTGGTEEYELGVVWVEADA